jgi:type VI secretion system protein ImpC
MAITQTGDVTFEFATRASKPRLPEPGKAFRILVLGDFSGASRDARQEWPVLNRRPCLRVDREDLEAALVRIAPSLTLTTAAGSHLSLAFSSLDDFHPDVLIEQVPAFGRLKALRRRLTSHQSFADAARELCALLHLSAPGEDQPAPTATQVTAAPTQPVSSLLDTVLSQTGTTTGQDAWLDHLVAQVAAPYRIPAADPRQEHYVNLLDQALSDLLSALLHHPDFQRLEAHWRGVDWLVRQVETDRLHSIDLLDVAEDELLEDLIQHQDNRPGALAKLLGDREAGGEDQRWSLVVILDRFMPTTMDAFALGVLARIGAATGTRILTDATPALVHSHSFNREPDPDDWNLLWPTEFTSAWTQLRSLPASQHLILAAPRLLLRLPYGRQASRIEGFDYEELGTDAHPEHLLWGSAALAVASVLARQQATGQEATFTQIDNLPLAYLTDQDGERMPVACAETWLTDRALRAMTDQGLTPLASIRGMPAIRVGPIRTLWNQ